MQDYIKIRGARQNNLKNINLDIPKGKLIVFTGLSGSGKSSMAFDTIYAEGQRRYVESLSAYARQFLGIMDKPDVDSIEGLSPAISIDQKTTSSNPRSTVGTITEIYDYLRLLFARIGHPHCPVCGREIRTQSVDEISESAIKLVEKILQSEKIARFLILSPIVIGRKGEFSNLFDNFKAKGFETLRIDQQIRLISEDLFLIKTNKHTIEVVIDKLSVSTKDFKNKIIKQSISNRIKDSVEQALKLSDGLIVISEVHDSSFEFPKFPKKFIDHIFSEKFSCPIDNIQIPEIEPRTFSFNSPYGACSSCFGIGKILKFDSNLITSPDLSIKEGAIIPYSSMFENDTWYSRLILKVCEENFIDTKIPYKKLTTEQKNILLFGTKERVYKVQGRNRFGKQTYIYETFPGIISDLERRYRQTDSEIIRTFLKKYMIEEICSQCKGSRLKKEALGITIDGFSISDVVNLSISEAFLWIKNLKQTKKLSERERQISGPILREIEKRFSFLISVGLDYLTLSRASQTLSSGETQRIRLASQIGSGLTGVLYILDEPTIGLHQKDNLKLINTLKKLRDLGNTVIVVEHDEEIIKNADFIVDFGPEAGKKGGEVVAMGKLEELIKNPKSIIGRYINGKAKINIQKETNHKSYLKNIYDNENSKKITIYGCRQYNLKNIKVEIPLGKLIAVTGVSGSGKSTLLVETLYPALLKSLNPNFRLTAGNFEKIEGTENINKVILIDQSPIGRTPRSNPATYTKVFDHIRDVFAQTREAKINGFKKGRFSFNVKGGRCEVCEGQGQIKIEMQFMSDIWIKCEVCKGKRYNSQTLDINYKGRNISDVLGMTVGEAYEFFHSHQTILNKLQTLIKVGLEYIELGQSATTLSGGEAQRVKLASELNKKDTGKTLYILDEPTTGLHFYDVQKLLNVLKTLVFKGNTVIVIEHNLNVIRNADWIIDLGPDGGEKGGYIVASGTIETIKKTKNSYLSEYL